MGSSTDLMMTHLLVLMAISLIVLKAIITAKGRCRTHRAVGVIRKSLLHMAMMKSL